jgi:uroporphyrinogen-III decarboxylase
MSDELHDQIEETIQRYIDIVHSKRNQINQLKWDHEIPWERGNWRALPKGKGLLVIDPDKPFIARMIGIDLETFYTQPANHILGWLQNNLYKFEHFHEDSYFSTIFCPWWGVVFEVSLFGVMPLFRHDREPWIGDPPKLDNKKDLDRLTQPSFDYSGLMPLVQETLALASSLFGGRITPTMPTWVRGPLSTAMQLRGMSNLLMDMLEDPSFVHQLMCFITDSRKNWLSQRAAYLKQPIQPGLLFNDEVGAPIISPRLYREFVLPYEIELAEFHGGIAYWHSCGNTTAFVNDLAQIPGLKLFHIGPNTDPLKAAKAFGPEVNLEICLQDVRDVYESSQEQIRQKFFTIAEACQGHNYYIRADGFDVVTTKEESLEKITRLVDIARQV